MNYMTMPGVLHINTNTLTKMDREELFRKDLAAVCRVYNEDPDEVLKQTAWRNRKHVEIRMICMTIFRCKHLVSLAISGAYFNKDHATVYHAIKTVRELRAWDKDFKTKTDPFLSGVNLNRKKRPYKRVKAWETH